MLNDTLAAALSKIMNAENAGKKECIIKPVSKTIKEVLRIFQENLFIGTYEEKEDSKGNYLIVNLLGKINKCGVVKPRFSVKVDDFVRFEKRFLLAKDFGYLIVTTPKGIMTHKEAIKNKTGGKLLAYVY